MQKLFVGFLVLVSSFMITTSLVSAHEGSIDLSSSTVSCKGVSLYQDGGYHIDGRCDGLTYPYQTLYNTYVLWGKSSLNGSIVRIAEVDKGYFSGVMADPFDTMFITAEKQSLVHKPSDIQVVTGAVTAFSFDKSQAAPTATTSTTSTSKNVTLQGSTSTVSSTAGAVVGKIVTSLLVIILVVVGLVIGASLIFRSRGSVSA